jgi:uncharacterized membrane protein
LKGKVHHGRKRDVEYRVGGESEWIPVIGILILLFTLILWLLLMIKALWGERYLLPIVGKMAEDKTGQ